MKHLLEYLYKVVKIETIDGRTLQGEVVSYSNAIENDLKFDEIDIDYKTHHEVVGQNEIETIRELNYTNS